MFPFSKEGESWLALRGSGERGEEQEKKKKTKIEICALGGENIFL